MACGVRKNASGLGSALDGAEAGRGDRSRRAGSLLVRGVPFNKCDRRFKQPDGSIRAERQPADHDCGTGPLLDADSHLIGRYGWARPGWREAGGPPWNPQVVIRTQVGRSPAPSDRSGTRAGSSLPGARDRRRDAIQKETIHEPQPARSPAPRPRGPAPWLTGEHARSALSSSVAHAPQRPTTTRPPRLPRPNGEGGSDLFLVGVSLTCRLRPAPHQ